MYTLSILFHSNLLPLDLFVHSRLFRDHLLPFLQFSYFLLSFEPPALICVLRGIAVPIRFTSFCDHFNMSSYLTCPHWSFHFALLSSRALLVYRTHCSLMRLRQTYFTFSSLAFLVYRTCCSTLMPDSIFPMTVHNSRSGNFTCTCTSDILFDIGRYNSLISLSSVYPYNYR